MGNELTSDIRRDVDIIFQDIAPRLSGNTAFNAMHSRLINDGFEEVLIESISPYGVKLNNARGGWANKKNRRTGRLLKGWFSIDCKNAGMFFIQGKGGYQNSMNVVRARITEEAQDNPLRQRIFAQYVAERGDSDVNTT